MKSSLKSSAVLLLSGLWLLSATPARSEPAGIFKATCDQIVESLKAHQWSEKPSVSARFPYFHTSDFTKSGATATVDTINDTTARISIQLPGRMLRAGLKEIYHKLGLPESAPSPDLDSQVGFEPTLIDGGGENWVMLNYSPGELWIIIGPKSFYRSSQDFKEDKIKPELCNARANEIAEDLAPH